MYARNTEPNPRHISIEQTEPDLWRGRFIAMNTPCEVMIECASKPLAEHWLRWCAEEAWRIEDKFSRFRTDSVIGILNRHTGKWMEIDPETDALLTFADQCWHLSDGLIDITIGSYLQHWRFDGQTPPPPRSLLKKTAAFVGWQHIKRQPGKLFLPTGFQLDLGGIGKEYAVDRIAHTLMRQPQLEGILVNLGGDIHIPRPKNNGAPWQIAIEAIHPTFAQKGLRLLKGAIATSGHTKRYAVDKHGKRLGHILNPKTGWPVRKGPASVTVLAETATQAGLMATLAMLKGAHAETFLKNESITAYCQWP